MFLVGEVYDPAVARVEVVPLIAPYNHAGGVRRHLHLLCVWKGQKRQAEGLR